MPPIKDHPQRLQLANELHARPFPQVAAPQQAVHLVLKPVENPANRDRAADHAHLASLLARHGTAVPPDDAIHFFGEIGRARLKWESHNEFLTYTAFLPGADARPFDPNIIDVFPADWLDESPLTRVTSLIVRIDRMTERDDIERAIDDWFVADSVAVSRLADGNAVLAGDFRLDPAGHMRFALLVNDEVGDRRTGRLVHRICEIETYKAMAMLGLERARELRRLSAPIEIALEGAVGEMNRKAVQPAQVLDELLSTAAELENLATRSSFRFSATRAYRAIVDQRIEVLREKRFAQRQTFGDFMMRRFDPAMRTVISSEQQLESLNRRALRAAELLRTRVDVERSAQNQAVLASMDRRADLQLRMQKTVEGLSVVAISYYGVNLAGYLLAPFADSLGMTKTGLLALLVLPIGALVWLGVHRIRRYFEKVTGPELG